MRLAPCPSHLTPHTSRLIPHASHLTPHTSHLTPHTSHLTPHTSRPTPPVAGCTAASWTGRLRTSRHALRQFETAAPTFNPAPSQGLPSWRGQSLLRIYT
ncbi:hypothetical protein B1808_14015, partial [Pseudofulvimonas gallinarii]